MKRIKIALAGCGRISENHFESFKALSSECKLAAVCDTDASRARAAAAKYNCEWFTDYKKMLAETDCDAVALATPSGLHPEMGALAAKAGLHVVSEKPMAVTMEGADTLIKACEKAGVKLFVVKQNRLNPTMQLLKKAVDKGRFGKIYTAHVNVFWQRPQSYYDMAPWRGTAAMDGGAFMNQASHYVDSLYWLLGEVSEVSAITATLARKIETEDTGSAVFKFKSGAVGSMSVTMLTYPKNLEGSITVIGEKGTVKVGGIAINNIQHWEFAEYDDDDGFIEKCNYNPPNVYGFGHIPYYKNVFACIRGEQEPETDGKSGRKSLEMILAIYKSAKEKKTVSLPLGRHSQSK
jgi:UDP-N-acetyl-2-amino-2-deoxyglucuronate dehydrogenase